MKKIVLIALSILPLVSLAGGGWTKKKGKGYYKVSEWWVTASKHYDNFGNTDRNARTTIANTTFYGEYGITDRLTGILFFPFFSHTHFDNQISSTGQVRVKGEQVNGIGDSDLSLKYRLFPESKFAIAASLTLGIPLGNDSGGSQGQLQTGDGEFNQMIRADISRSFNLIKGVGTYANIYTAFNNRTAGFSDEVRFGGELGASIFKGKFWFIYRVDVLESLLNGNETFEGTGTTVFANNTEFFSYTYEAAYYISEKWGVSAAYGGAFSGKLIAAAPSYSVGVFLDIK